MVIAFGQIFTAFRTTLRVRFPANTESFMVGFRFVNLDVFRLTNFDCVLPVSENARGREIVNDMSRVD
jgi:hypothetical protein